MRPRACQSAAAGAVLGAIREGRDGLVRMPTRCHPAGVRVLMFDGTTKDVSEVQIGDQLMGPDSLPRHVLDVHSGVDDTFEVRPNKGKAWRVNRNHVLYGQWTEAQRQGRDRLFTVDEWFSASTYFRHCTKLFRASVDFPQQARPLPLDPYFLGLLLGDGGFHPTFSITTMDEEIVAAIHENATLLGLKVREEHKPNNRAITYVLTYSAGRAISAMRGERKGGQMCLPGIERGDLLHERIRDLGLQHVGAADKFIPHVYLTASAEDRLSLLAGLMDTDGHYSKRGFDYISKSPRLADGVAFLCRSLGLSAYVAACQKFCQTGGGGTYHRVSISGEVERIPVRLPRKKAAPRLSKVDVRRTGFTIVPTGEVERVYGFTLDGDALYLLDDFTVTHNSGKSIAMGLVLRRLQERGTLPQVYVVTSRTMLVDDLVATFWRLLDPAARSFSAADLDRETKAVRKARRGSAIVGRWDGHRQQVGRVIVTTYPSLPSLVEAHGLPDILIADEAHRTKGARVRALVEQVPLRYGFTATPHGRDDRDGLPFTRVVYALTYAEAVEQGVIVPWRAVWVEGG